ncbi:thiamine biosynthesis lipoprotein ApbE precursor [Anaerotignum neopropionicum]|uniref:FAD:protein FMN transferase n=1 Tax=Anaerotignum neopropionicum TaxID=36847 RepID=A0A136WG22_9FIRM|nr:FAD:protein FMN transferase [Anaerotignum neopropionicum]KXL53319.1 thiamine biosynthesis lipoprotein ApbE precursor [Anaerotignum neopropionicum]
MKKLRVLAIVLCSLFILGGCVEQRKEAQEMLSKYSQKDLHEMTTFAMDTLMQVTLYNENGEQLLIDAEQEIRKLERLFSVTMEDSEIAQLNEQAGLEEVSLSEDTLKVLMRGKEIGAFTNQAFNITVSPVVKAWGFTTDGEKHVPSQKTLESLLSLTNPEDLVIDRDASTAKLLKKGMAVDLGGVAKGYTSDAVTELLKKEGVTSGIISLGGNISAIGTKPDGKKWKVAVENPLDVNDYVGILEVEDCSVITSGGYQRFFEENGKRYHHIIDSNTGYPADKGLLSVTIISNDGAKADGLSTALFVMGFDEAVKIWRNSDDFEVIFVTEDGKVIATEGVAAIFAFEGRDNDFAYEIVER